MANDKMTGIVIDLFTVILMIVIAFMCGYSAGHRVGRYETRTSFENLAKTIMNKDALEKHKGDIK
jgi:hypothetical protein